MSHLPFPQRVEHGFRCAKAHRNLVYHGFHLHIVDLSRIFVHVVTFLNKFDICFYFQLPHHIQGHDFTKFKILRPILLKLTAFLNESQPSFFVSLSINRRPKIVTFINDCDLDIIDVLICHIQNFKARVIMQTFSKLTR